MSFICQQLIPLGCPAVPWVGAWGTLNLNNLAAGGFYPFVSESAALAAGSEALSRLPFPSVGGFIDSIAFRFRTATIAVNITLILVVNGADVAASNQLTVLAGVLAGSLVFSSPIVLVPAADISIGMRFTCSGLPGAATTRPAFMCYGRTNG